MAVDGSRSQGRLLGRALAFQVAVRNLIFSYHVAGHDFTNSHHLKVVGSFRPWAFVFNLTPAERQRVAGDMRGALDGLGRADSLSSKARPEHLAAVAKLAALEQELELWEE